MKKAFLIVLALFTVTVFADGHNHLANSKVEWKAYKVIGGGHNGEIPITHSKLKLDEGKLISGEIHFSVKDATVTDLTGEWAKKFLGHIKSGDFFEVEKYPTAVLKLNSVRNNVGTGTLTIKDKTNPIKIQFNRKGKTYSGEVSFDRTDYGIIYGSQNFFKNLGDKAISNNVDVTFSLELK